MLHPPEKPHKFATSEWLGPHRSPTPTLHPGRAFRSGPLRTWACCRANMRPFPALKFQPWAAGLDPDGSLDDAAGKRAKRIGWRAAMTVNIEREPEERKNSRPPPNRFALREPVVMSRLPWRGNYFFEASSFSRTLASMSV